MQSGNMQVGIDATHSDFTSAQGDVTIDLTTDDVVIDLHAPTPPAFDRAPRFDPPVEDLDAGLVAASRGQLVAKRTLDVVLSVVLLVLLLPVLVLAGLAVWSTSHGPVFYVQERVGRSGIRFRMLKFRSMYVDAHERKAQLAALNEATGPAFKVRKDPRVTPVGRVIRKLSIDELPQLFNVLRGDMSLVGPRPPLPEEYATYDAYAMRRLLVTPGLTCIWQVSGRSNIDFEQWVEMDVEYIRDWTFGSDLALLAKTVPAVLTGRGAY